MDKDVYVCIVYTHTHTHTQSRNIQFGSVQFSREYYTNIQSGILVIKRNETKSFAAT